MNPKVIPQRELRNDIARVLREAAKGQTFTITVHGKPIAALGPPVQERRVDVDSRKVAEILAMPIDSDDLAAELDAAETPVT